MPLHRTRPTGQVEPARAMGLFDCDQHFDSQYLLLAVRCAYHPPLNSCLLIICGMFTALSALTHSSRPFAQSTISPLTIQLARKAVLNLEAIVNCYTFLRSRDLVPISQDSSRSCESRRKNGKTGHDVQAMLPKKAGRIMPYTGPSPPSYI